MRRSMILWLGLVVLSAASLFLIKTEVQQREDQLAALHQDINRAQQAIHVLKAEWSYLNRPERLSELVERHLDLVPINRSRMASLDTLPSRPTNTPLPAPTTVVPAREPE